MKISGFVRVLDGPQESRKNILLNISVLKDYVKGRWRLPYLERLYLWTMRGDAGSKSRSMSSRAFLVMGKFYSKRNFTKSKPNTYKKMARPDDE